MTSKSVVIALATVSSLGILSLAFAFLRADAMTVSATCDIEDTRLGRETTILKVSGRNLAQPVTFSVEGSKFVKTDHMSESKEYDMEAVIDAEKGEVLDAEFTAPNKLNLNVKLLCQ